MKCYVIIGICHLFIKTSTLLSTFDKFLLSFVSLIWSVFDLYFYLLSSVKEFNTLHLVGIRLNYFGFFSTLLAGAYPDAKKALQRTQPKPMAMGVLLTPSPLSPYTSIKPASSSCTSVHLLTDSVLKKWYWRQGGVGRNHHCSHLCGGTYWQLFWQGIQF